MRHDPELVAETKAWFARAAQDLRAGEVVLSTTPPLTADVVFHAQQAAEKTMKGFLTWHSRPFRKTHNLIEIGEACVAIDASLEPLLRRAATLSEYAWKYHYPGELDEPALAEAEGHSPWLARSTRPSSRASRKKCGRKQPFVFLSLQQ